MNKSFNFFHEELLKKSSNLKNLNEQIKKNGVIKIERTNWTSLLSSPKQ